MGVFDALDTHQVAAAGRLVAACVLAAAIAVPVLGAANTAAAAVPALSQGARSGSGRNST
jgi:hypothetical protein